MRAPAAPVGVAGFLRGHWQLIAVTAAIFALWQTPLVIPLKILIVVMHEASHAAMALATGGEVVSLTVTADQGGLVVARGGNRFLTLSAGYLGSLAIGAAVLLAALRTAADRIILAGFGLALLVIALLYVRDLFALLFIVATGAAMLAGARTLPLAACDMVLRVIGLSSLFYVPYDIFDDTIARSTLRSDAWMLADEFGGPTLFWGGLWLLLSLGVIAACLRFALGQSSNLVRGGRDRPTL